MNHNNLTRFTKIFMISVLYGHATISAASHKDSSIRSIQHRQDFQSLDPETQNAVTETLEAQHIRHRPELYRAIDSLHLEDSTKQMIHGAIEHNIRKNNTNTHLMIDGRGVDALLQQRSQKSNSSTECALDTNAVSDLSGTSEIENYEYDMSDNNCTLEDLLLLDAQQEEESKNNINTSVTADHKVQYEYDMSIDKDNNCTFQDAALFIDQSSNEVSAVLDGGNDFFAKTLEDTTSVSDDNYQQSKNDLDIPADFEPSPSNNIDDSIMITGNVVPISAR